MGKTSATLKSLRKSAILAKNGWLGDLDSNQGYPGQSQVFYR